MFGTSSIRLLVVDDYEPWRRFLGTTFAEQPELQVIGEASDGLEAIQKAQNLQPDLILLDVGLPKLDGIGAALRIHELVPTAKILFVTQNCDVDVVATVFSHGACGYLLKMDAGQELIVAIQTIIRGDRFVCKRLASQSSDSIRPSPKT